MRGGPPRGLIGPVFAMSRPRRPAAERDAVIAAAGPTGSAAQRARRVAQAVALAAIADVDRDPAERILALLRDLSPTPVDVLATAPEMGTAQMILSERVQRLRNRGGRRLSERAQDSEDKEIIAAVASVLSERYRRLLAK